MTPFTFVHAADLHLDAPFRGVRAALLEGKNRHLAELLRNASFEALARLTDLCVTVGADFLLLAGDVYNAADSSLRARLALRDAFVRLERANIQVFMVHGNHDPLQGDDSAIPWPGNVTVFGPEIETRLARRSEVPLALIHGISHTTDKEERNLARLFGRTPPRPSEKDLFQIGLLHCSLAGASAAHATYAPCTPGDLSAAGLDYWALGHVHAPRIMGQRDAAPKHPYIVYPGSLQGMHVNETGPHGCVVTRVDENGTARAGTFPLAPLRWESLAVDLEKHSPESIPALEALLLESLDTLAPGALAPPSLVPGAGGPVERGPENAPEDATYFFSGLAPMPPRACLTRLSLTGRSPLDHELRAPGALEDLRAHLERELDGSGVWIRDIFASTRPMADLEALETRADLVGAVLRAAKEASGNPEAMARAREEALRPLFQRPRLRKILEEPDDAEFQALAAEAALLCLDLLEGE